MKALTNLWITLFCLGSTSVAWAGVVPRSHIGPFGIDFQANSQLSYGTDSNVTYQHKDPIASSFFELTPVIQASGLHNGDQYLLRYTGHYLRYQRMPQDNSNQNTWQFHGNWRLGLRHDIDFQWLDDQSHETRGQGVSLGFVPQQFERFNLSHPMGTRFQDMILRYNYGAPDAEGKLSFAVEHKNFIYQNIAVTNEETDKFARYITDQNWGQTTYIGELFDQVSRDTRFRYSIIANLRRYKTMRAHIKDSNEYYFWYGIKSKRSGKTTINMNVSWLYKEFIRDPQNRTFSGLNWNMDVAWKPVSYTTFRLYTKRHIKDPNSSGGYILDTSYGASWVYHWWYPRLYSEIDYSIEHLNYKNQDNHRKDKVNSVSISLNYQFRPSINVSLSYLHQTHRSNLAHDYFYIGDSSSVICTQSEHSDPDCISRTLGYNQSMIMLTTQVQF